MDFLRDRRERTRRRRRRSLAAEPSCSEQGSYGTSCKGPRISDGSCCCTSWFMPTESECEADAEWLETYCGEDFQQKKTELADKCCYYDEARKAIESAMPPQKASRSACREMIASMEAACGSKREGKRGEFKANCCGRFDDLKQEASQVPSGGLFPCDDGGGSGSGDDTQKQEDNSQFDDSGDSPYKCGNTDKGDSGIGEKIAEGVFDLAGQGMCALFNETCQQGAGDKSVYCCRQDVQSGGSSGSGGGGVAGIPPAQLARSEAKGDLTQTQPCGPGGQPPGWVPGWMPGGYTESQYLQAFLLAALLGVSAFYLIGALFGGEDEEKSRQPVVVNLGGGASSRAARAAPAGAAKKAPSARRPSSAQLSSKTTQSK